MSGRPPGVSGDVRGADAAGAAGRARAELLVPRHAPPDRRAARAAPAARARARARAHARAPRALARRRPPERRAPAPRLPHQGLRRPL